LQVIIELVIERAASIGNFSVLMKTNYYDWAALMHVMLHAHGLRIVVSEGTSTYTEDRMALEVIAKAVPPELLGSITSKPSVKAAWNVIIMCNVGADCVRKANVSSIKWEFDAITFLDGELIDDFTAQLGWITNQLVVLGFEYKEEEIMRKFLLALPPKLEQIATSIEMLLDLEMVTDDELVGRLKPSEERINRNGGGTVASLNITKDELIMKLMSCLKITGGGNTN
jgi:hypothetical protein